MEKTRMLVITGIIFVVVMLFFGWCYTEKSARTEKIGWRVIGLLTVAFVVFAFWYHIPVRCEEHIQVVEERSQKETVINLELFIRRSFLKGTQVSGWICTPQDTYGTYKVGNLTRDKDRYHCSAMFQADTMMAQPSFDNSILSVTIDFSGGFKKVTYLRLIERRGDAETYWYQTPATS